MTDNFQRLNQERTRRGLTTAILVSSVAAICAILFQYLILGHLVVIPLLDSIQSSRLDSGSEVTVFEAAIVFIISVIYTLETTITIILAGLSGKFVLNHMNK